MNGFGNRISNPIRAPGRFGFSACNTRPTLPSLIPTQISVSFLFIFPLIGKQPMGDRQSILIPFLPCPLQSSHILSHFFFTPLSFQGKLLLPSLRHTVAIVLLCQVFGSFFVFALCFEQFQCKSKYWNLLSWDLVFF